MLGLIFESATKSAASVLGWLSVEIEIENQSGQELHFRHDWYNHGYVGGNGWPSVIAHGQTVKVQCFQRMFAVVGVSGTVTYDIGSTSTPLTIAFSCPSLGTNKLNVGSGGSRVWDEMQHNDYEPWAKVMQAGSVTLNIACQSTSGTGNAAKVRIYKASQ